jgi:hypothetical protein
LFIRAILARGRAVLHCERREQHAIKVRIAHAYLVHVGERGAQVVDIAPALAAALRHEAGGGRHVEIPGELAVRRIGNEGKRPDLFATPHPDAHETRHIHAIAHFPVPEVDQDSPRLRGRNPVGDAPAGAAGAKAHDESRLPGGPAVAMRVDAKSAMIAVNPARRFLAEAESGRPHERAIAEHPEPAERRQAQKLGERHARFNAARGASVDIRGGL